VNNLNLCHNGRWVLLLLRHAHRASTVDAVPGWFAAAAFMVYGMRFLVAAPSELSPWFSGPCFFRIETCDPVFQAACFFCFWNLFSSSSGGFS
jgi:hypothetical protein